MATASEVLKIAASQIGYSRWDDPKAGTKYGRWFAGITHESYYGQSGVPYCAMFVSWVLNKAGQACAGFPGAYCPTILATARRAGLAVAYKSARPGDIVFFDWDGGVTDHVGIIELNKSSYYQTIEGNTGNGQVLRRTRSLSTVCGVIRPHYTAGTAKPTTDATKPITSKPKKLDVDGAVGVKTVTRWQQIMGTTVDGIISGQSEWNRPYLPAVYAIDYRGGGSQLVKAVQRVVGAAVDGYLGPETVRKLQARLGVEQDGYLGKVTAKALQRRLNEGRF